jgi:hypothetical protein
MYGKYNKTEEGPFHRLSSPIKFSEIFGKPIDWFIDRESPKPDTDISISKEIAKDWYRYISPPWELTILH